jgi:hypothetical protein
MDFLIPINLPESSLPVRKVALVNFTYSNLKMDPKIIEIAFCM